MSIRRTMGIISLTCGFLLCVILYGCDDLKILYFYNKSDIQNEIENELYKVGDMVRVDENVVELCIIPPYTEIAMPDRGTKGFLFSSAFWMVVVKKQSADIEITWIHNSWLQTPGGDKICADRPIHIIVRSIVDRRIFIEVSGT